MKDFKDKVAVITGGASGVGFAIGERLGRAGARLVLADIEKGALDQAVADLRERKIDVIGQITDVSKADQVEALAERSFGHFGGVHLVFNNAGVGAGGGPTPWGVSEKAWTWGFNVNFYGVVNGIDAFMPRLLKQNQEAHICNTSSGIGLLYPPGSPVYSATKAGVVAITEMMHYQLMMMQSPVKAALLFPGPYVVETGLFNSARNRPAEFADEAAGAGGISSLEDMQQMMEKTIGRRIETTKPAEFAEYTYQALLQDKFWILPMNDRQVKAMRDRLESMIAGTNPLPPDVL